MIRKLRLTTKEMGLKLKLTVRGIRNPENKFHSVKDTTQYSSSFMARTQGYHHHSIIYKVEKCEEREEREE